MEIVNKRFVVFTVHFHVDYGQYVSRYRYCQELLEGSFVPKACESSEFIECVKYRKKVPDQMIGQRSSSEGIYHHKHIILLTRWLPVGNKGERW